MTKTITILTGPQGSGNHLFSKIFSLSDQVHGWPENLTSAKWVGHDQEPYNKIWTDDNAIDAINWEGDFHIISVSCPFVADGLNKVPNYERIVNQLQAKGFLVQFAIIGRDRNILDLQQLRLRDVKSSYRFIDQLDYLTSKCHTFVSQELAYLYGAPYIKSIAVELDIPVTLNARLDGILKEDANNKYIHQVFHTEQDNEIWEASKVDRYIDITEDGC